MWPAILEAIEFKRETLTLEEIWLLLVIRQKFPKSLNKKFVVNAFGRKKLVADELCEDVTRVLLASSVPINILRRHPVFNPLVVALRNEELLEKFWSEHIDPILAKDATSPYKTMLAFAILSVMLETATDEERLDKYLTTSVVESALTFLSRIESSPEDDSKLLNVLAKFSEKAVLREELQVPILSTLMSEPGSVCFDKLTGGTVVHQLLSGSKSEAVKHISSLLRSAVLGEELPKSGHARTSQERVYAAQQLAKLTSHTAMHEELEWKEDTLKFLLSTTLFKPAKKSKLVPQVPVAFSREAVGQLRTTFFKSLDFKTKTLEKLCDILSNVFQHSKALKEAGVPLAHPLKPAADQAWEKVAKTISAIEKSKGECKREGAVFLLFFINMAFHLLADQDMACEMLEELHQCHNRSMQKSKRKSAGGGEKEPHWVEVVTELLISLQSHNQLALRHLASSVFKMICSSTTTESLQAILDVIDVIEENKPNDEEEDDQIDSGNEEEWEDVEEETEEGKEEEAGSSDAESMDSEDDDDDAEEETGEPDEVLRKRVKAALGEHAAEDDDDGDEDEEDIDMDDIPEEDMAKMDEALANVFKQLSGGKKSGSEKKKERKEAMAKIHFRVRCLDLLDVYLSQEPQAVHVFLALQRTLSALEKSKSKAEEEFRSRLLNTVKKIAGLRKNLHQIKIDKADSDQFVTVLQSLVDLANRGSPLIVALEGPIPLYAQCCFLVLKLGQTSKNAKVEKQLDDVFFKAVDDFFKHR